MYRKVNDVKITLDMLEHKKVVPFPLEIQNYLLTLLGGGANNLHLVADYVDPSDFISFCTTPDYVACRSSMNDVVVCAVTTCKVTEAHMNNLRNAVYQLSPNRALYINTVNNMLVVVEAHYAHAVRSGEAGMYSLEQVVEISRRIVGESYNVY